MGADIRHCGVVDDVTDGCVKVRIVQSSACASCKVAGHCNASESKEKIVDVYERDARKFAVGDNVVVVASSRMGMFVVLLSSVIPLFVLVAVLVAVYAATNSEGRAAVASLCALIPYYLILYLCRERIRARLSFRIEPDCMGTVMKTDINN